MDTVLLQTGGGRPDKLGGVVRTRLIDISMYASRIRLSPG